MIQCCITDGSGSTLSRNLSAGVDWIQLRAKNASARELFALVRRALALPNPHGTKILVNTRVDIAVAADAAGAHLPSHSPPPQRWRAITSPGFLIGVSCHSVDEVRASEDEGADYALFGPVFAPLSKSSDLVARGLDELARAASAVRIPVLALGGITREKAAMCVAAGAAGVAGISLYAGTPCG